MEGQQSLKTMRILSTPDTNHNKQLSGGPTVPENHENIVDTRHSDTGQHQQETVINKLGKIRYHTNRRPMSKQNSLIVDNNDNNYHFFKCYTPLLQSSMNFITVNK